MTLLASTVSLAELRKLPHDETDVLALRAIEDASALFRSRARQTISLVQDDEVELAGNWSGRLWLPERPVVAVSSIAIVAGGVTSAVALSAVQVSRRGLLALGRLGEGPSISLSDPLWPYSGSWGGPDATVKVKYSHGYADVPKDVEAVVLAMALRRIANPEGLSTETIAAGSASMTYGGVGVSLEEEEVIKKYRPRVN